MLGTDYVALVPFDWRGGIIALKMNEVPEQSRVLLLCISLEALASGRLAAARHHTLLVNNGTIQDVLRLLKSSITRR